MERTVIGSRIVVTGMAGSGKSTFSRRLAAITGLPLIHLDLHIWDPGWVRVSASKLLEKQHQLLAANHWIVDSNDVDPNLIVQRADTLIVLATPWWICSWRAFKRGIRRPPKTQLPEGCPELARQRIQDEWGIAWRNWRNRKQVLANELALAKRCQELMHTHVARSSQELAELEKRLTTS